MECPRGSEIKVTRHEIKTLSKAKEWFAASQEYDLPITIQKYAAKNGRLRIEVYDNLGKLIHQRG